MPNGEIEPLSERELELVQLLGQGLSNREIAQTLFISLNTVKVHLRNIYNKLHVSSRTEATMVALRQGLIEIDLPDQGGPAEPSLGLSSPDTPAGEKAGEQETPLALPAPLPSLRPWQRIYMIASILLVTLGFWAIGPHTAQPQGPFPGPAPQSPGQPPDTASRWKALAQLTQPRRRLAAAAYDGRLYAIAGEASDGITGAVEIYTADDNDWNPGADKPSPAADVGATVLDGQIYVPGGVLADGTISDRLEIYTPEQDGPGHWSTGTAMLRPMSAYASAAYDGALYLFGGWDGARYSAEAAKYDPATEQWTRLSPMSAPCGFAGAGTVEDRIYVLGGYDGQDELNTCEAYDPRQDQWEACPPLNAPRGGAGVAVVGDTLYVIGGGWKSYLVENEYWTITAETPGWQTFSSPLLQEWRNLGVAANGTFIYAVGGWDGDFLAVNQAYRALFRLYLPSLEGKDNGIEQDLFEK
jgi:DNA-binding CsgD family transcriptional regulator/N-acetylneuraminic acid mutarotase